MFIHLRLMSSLTVQTLKAIIIHYTIVARTVIFRFHKLSSPMPENVLINEVICDI